MYLFESPLDEDELRSRAFKRNADQVMEDLKKGIYPSFDGIYYYVEAALLKNPHIAFDAERMVKVIIWELGPALEDLPKKDYTGFLLEHKVNYKEMTFFHYLVNLLVNGVEAGNTFIKQLAVIIYRIYFPKQYRQYKRFSKVNADFLYSFVITDEEDDDFSGQLALFIARADNKELEDYVWVFIANADRDTKLQLEEERKEKKLIISDEAKGLIDEINLPGTSAAKAFDAALDFMRDHIKADKYTISYLDMIVRASFHIDRIKEVMERSLRAARKEGTTELKDIMRIFLYGLLLERISLDEEMWKNTIGYFCGENDFEPDFKVSFFDESRVKKKEEKISFKSERKIDSEKADTSGLEKELQAAKDEGKLKHSQLQSVMKRCEELEKRNAELEEKEKKYREEHFELAKLRDYVYSLTEEEETGSAFDRESVIKQLKGKKIVIIGGHENWLGKLKEMFPKWSYIGAVEMNGQIEYGLLHADMIYFFTDHLSHRTFNKYMDFIRGRGLNFSYIHSVNIERNLRQMERDMYQ